VFHFLEVWRSPSLINTLHGMRALFRQRGLSRITQGADAFFVGLELGPEAVSYTRAVCPIPEHAHAWLRETAHGWFCPIPSVDARDEHHTDSEYIWDCVAIFANQ
jgi:hypothetical protein